MTQDFGKNLKEVLKGLEMNQTEFAERTGLTRAAVSQLLNGGREPSYQTILKILAAIPVKFERLIR